ncbi:hypothetical protein ABZP36_011929 [Zizania latifolia]
MRTKKTKWPTNKARPLAASPPKEPPRFLDETESPRSRGNQGAGLMRPAPAEAEAAAAAEKARPPSGSRPKRGRGANLHARRDPGEAAAAGAAGAGGAWMEGWRLRRRRGLDFSPLVLKFEGVGGMMV